ncbi:outer membrane protein assembly factor BamA [Salaquimonas pukyongi]|uniref:outer membrane protein assembly factor BamA n=1 Tax=Salaquimonas pukyongi TaxID=2712698 RepID=UPI00096B9478|nr:outer membrane protein assembly factor BamA [Salaquimonas pukyongi]
MVRMAMLAVAIAVSGGGMFLAGSLATASIAEAAVVSAITVRGNTRMDSDTVKSFLTIEPGQRFTNADIDASLKALFATGLFADVSIYQSGSTLVVEVDENATINEVFFEGNKRLKDEPLAGMIQSRARGIFSPDTVASDVSIIEEAYSRAGRGDAVITSEVVPLANNRVNLVFKVNEGGKTKIRSVTFVGNNAFRAGRLREVMSTKRTNLLSWLRNDDIYDPDKLAADEEKLRRFYFNNGYADFQILSTSAVLDEVSNEYNITITVDEGTKYTFDNIAIESTLDGVDTEALYSKLKTKPGTTYSAERVENSIIALTEAVAAQGYAFVDVAPRGNRNFNSSTIDVTYLIDQGARTYIERIIIIGNDMTRDYVIRREFDISEGDAFNQVFIQKSKKRLEGLGLFERVEISTRQGSSADRVVVVVRVAEKASGDFSVGGGYSSSSGALGEIAFTEKNFMGRGQLLRISASFGEAEENYRLSFTEPYFLGYRMSAGFDIGRNSRGDTDSRRYGSTTTFGSLRLGLPLTEHSGVSVFYTYNDSSTDIDSDLLDTAGTQGDAKGELSAALTPPNSPTDWTRSGFGYTWTYNTLDNSITPRDGVRLEFSQTAFGAGGDATYLTSEVKGQAFATLSEDFDFVGMIQGRAGANTAFGGNSGYRTLDNFFQGGRAIRGFSNNGFGPRDPVTGDALGGMYYWNATAEVNFPAPFLPETYGIRGAFFADAGTLWGVDSGGKKAIAAAHGTTSSALGDVNDNAMRASIGASIIWNSPFGPLRFDYAEPIVREKYDDLRRFSFGVSTSF